MIIDLELQRDEKNGGFLDAQAALDKDGIEPYDPGREGKDVTNLIVNDFTNADIVRNKPYLELNDRSVVERLNEDQRSFNSYQEPRSSDPDEQWKSNAVRPIVRNKIISIAAHITGSLIFPNVIAQNLNDEEDRDAAIVMRDLMEWAGEQADYEKKFLHTVIAALVNPAAILHHEFREVFRTIKTTQNRDGSWNTKEILDEDNSGFNLDIVPVDELWIANAYEHEIQKQPFLIWRRVLDYGTARTKYKNNENFDKFVRPGIQFLFSGEEDTFYQQWDTELEGNLVEEVIYYNKSSDLKVTLVNGILMDDPAQPNPRKDKKYPFVNTGFELIDEGRFFYFKSLAFKTAPDEDVVQTLYRMTIDGTFMQLMPPVAIFGSDEIGASVVIPGRVTSLAEDAKITKIDTGGNLSAGKDMLDRVEGSITESTTTGQTAGLPTKGEQTAFEIGVLERNAITQLGLFGKMIGFLVKDLGDLMMGDILQHITVGEVTELVGSNARVKFRNFLIADRTSEGKKKSRRLEFDGGLPEEMTPQDALSESFNILDREGALDADTEIFKINPSVFRTMKFKTKVTADIVTPPSENVQRALNLEAFDRAIQLPFADQEALYKDLLLGSYQRTREDPDRYVKEKNDLASLVGAEMKGPTAPGGSPAKPPTEPVNTSGVV